MMKRGTWIVDGIEVCDNALEMLSTLYNSEVYAEYGDPTQNLAGPEFRGFRDGTGTTVDSTAHGSSRA